ncbi:hypothetical protein ACT6NV_12550 [Robiginitalea sp. IMCC44478]|uniref:hypothetical protein n=1 Tax=Robiginitalea sp. IMCC44478 TaxID=3459122 RepID=UPI004041E7A1
MAIRNFIVRIVIYGLLIICLLEGLVRIFHLHKDTPSRMIDSYGVEKWVPNQSGYSVTGNRRQNVGEYRINASGFNSYREFNPTDEAYEVALVGDSFIEGFHQDYDESIGNKIEKQLPDISVYEYGYAGYDLADELHLIKAYDSAFQKIDKIFIYLKYPDDLRRDAYSVSQERMRLEKGVYRFLKNSKLLVYCQNIGLLSAITRPISKLKAVLIPKDNSPRDTDNSPSAKEKKYLSNFKKLWEEWVADTGKIVLLLDAKTFPKEFIQHLKEQDISYLDYGPTLDKAVKPVTLIYDQHWNDYGRELVAGQIIQTIKKD